MGTFADRQVILLYFPFSDLSATKLRPALLDSGFISAEAPTTPLSLPADPPSNHSVAVGLYSYAAFNVRLPCSNRQRASAARRQVGKGLPTYEWVRVGRRSATPCRLHPLRGGHQQWASLTRFNGLGGEPGSRPIQSPSASVRNFQPLVSARPP